MNIFNAKNRAFYIIEKIDVKETSARQKIEYLGFMVGKKIYKERNGVFNSCQMVVIDGKRVVIAKEISKGIQVNAI